jgi:hypothetical protein
MNWEAIAAIGQMIGALAVVVSIVYLSIQIRANTRTTRGSASYEAAHSWAQTNDQTVQLPDAVLATMIDWYSLEPGASQVSATDRVRMTQHSESVFRKLEGQYYLYKYGLLDAAQWETRRMDGRFLISAPYVSAWWNGDAQYLFPLEFRRVIETAQLPPLPGGPPIPVSRVAPMPGGDRD